ncbi:DUF1673 family protein [Methanoculleus caldifontis]|nr:DUF1673 family protein [Methanoculleus sp. Wushi-C6]
MMPFMETIRAYLGWCPMTGSMRPDLAVRPATVATAGGQDALLRVEPGWWRRHHNQLLVTAVAFSAAATAALLLIEDAPGYPTLWTGLGIGVGALLGSLLSYRSRYARVAAGELRRENMTRRQRIVQYLKVPVLSVVFAVGVAYLVLGGMFDRVIALVLGASLIFWTWYGLTILWERRHRAIMIAEWGSVYTLDMATEGERA